MALRDLFRRPASISDAQALADFIDANAAFVAQKGIYEYARARAGHYAKVLFREPEFQHAVEEARWRAYPLGLSMVGQMVEGVLRPHVAGDRRTVHDALAALVLSAFDRYPVPAPLNAASWREARHEVERHVDLAGYHAPKLVKDIPEPFAERYFGLMPIHEKLRRSDYPAIRNYLRVCLINVHDDLIKRLDAPAVVRSMLSPDG